MIYISWVPNKSRELFRDFEGIQNSSLCWYLVYPGSFFMNEVPWLQIRRRNFSIITSQRCWLWSQRLNGIQVSLPFFVNVMRLSQIRRPELFVFTKAKLLLQIQRPVYCHGILVNVNSWPFSRDIVCTIVCIPYFLQFYSVLVF